MGARSSLAKDFSRKRSTRLPANAAGAASSSAAKAQARIVRNRVTTPRVVSGPQRPGSTPEAGLDTRAMHSPPAGDTTAVDILRPSALTRRTRWRDISAAYPPHHEQHSWLSSARRIDGDPAFCGDHRAALRPELSARHESLQ